MVANTTADYTVEVACDCPNCGSENTATQEHTAEMFDDDSGYSSQCQDCGFHFRAYGIAEDDEISIEDATEGQKVTVRYDMIQDGYTHEIDTEVVRVDEFLDCTTVVVTTDDDREIALRSVTGTAALADQEKTIGENVRIEKGR